MFFQILKVAYYAKTSEKSKFAVKSKDSNLNIYI